MVALVTTFDKVAPASLLTLIILGLLFFLRLSEPSKTGKTALTAGLIFAFIAGVLLIWASAR